MPWSWPFGISVNWGTKPRLNTRTKRDIFSELVEGFDALKSAREDKLTLRQVKVHANPVPTLKPQYLLAVIERLYASRAVFAHYLRTKPRTVEKWKQGRTKFKAQVALLIRMVAQFPNTAQRLKAVKLFKDRFAPRWSQKLPPLQMRQCAFMSRQYRLD